MARQRAPSAPRDRALIFEHGRGVQGRDCPPGTANVLLAEAEGRLTIEAEFAKAALHMTNEGLTLPGLTKPRERVRVELGRGRVSSTVVRDMDIYQALDFVVDGYDPGRRIGYEFLSQEDYVIAGGLEYGYERLLDRKGRSIGAVAFSVEGRDYLEAARHLDKVLRSSCSGCIIAVFYDPAMDYSDGDRASARQRSLEALRQQVADFIAYLRSLALVE